MLLKVLDMYMDVIINITVYNSAYICIYLLHTELCM